jgi:hypothetical protein
MAIQQNTQCINLLASADLSAKQYHFVEVSGVRTVAACNATTDQAIGVLQNDPDASGEEAVIAINGTTKVVAGAAITAGARVAPNASGRAQTAVATQFPRGIALETSTADGQLIEVLLLPLIVTA